MSRTAFIALSLAAYMRRWKSPVSGKAPVATWPSGWPKNALCFHCKEAGHDPLAEHKYSFIPDHEWHKIPKLTEKMRKQLNGNDGSSSE